MHATLQGHPAPGSLTNHTMMRYTTALYAALAVLALGGHNCRGGAREGGGVRNTRVLATHTSSLCLLADAGDHHPLTCAPGAACVSADDYARACECVPPVCLQLREHATPRHQRRQWVHTHTHVDACAYARADDTVPPLAYTAFDGSVYVLFGDTATVSGSQVRACVCSPSLSLSLSLLGSCSRCTLSPGLACRVRRVRAPRRQPHVGHERSGGGGGHTAAPQPGDECGGRCVWDLLLCCCLLCCCLLLLLLCLLRCLLLCLLLPGDECYRRCGD
jgi:hypothetical protein